MKKHQIISILISIGLLASFYFNHTRAPIAIISLAGIAIISGLLAIRTTKEETNQTSIVILLFILASIVSLIFSETQNVGIDEILLDVSAATLLIALTLIHKWEKYIFKLIYLLIPIQAVVTFIQVLTRIESRTAGTFLNKELHTNYFPNALGLFWVLTIPLLLLTENKKIKPYKYLLLALGSSSLILTFSRGAIIATVTSLTGITLYLLSKKHFKRVLKTLLAIGLGLIIAIGLTQLRVDIGLPTNNFIAKSKFEGTESITSVQERKEFLTNSLKLVEQKPLLGHGPNSFPYVYPQVQTTLLANAPHPHNWILKLASERGMITALLFITLALIVLVKAIRNFRNNNTIILTMTATGAGLHSMIDFNMNFVLNMTIFIIILAALINQTSKTKPSKKTNASIAILIPILIVTTIFTFNTYIKSTLANKVLLTNKDKAAEHIKDINFNNTSITLADIHLENGQTQKAINVLQNHIQQNPHDAFAINKLGLIHQTPHPQKALELFEEAVKQDPMNLLNYHANYYRSLKQLNPTEFNNRSNEARKLLQNYIPLAEQNIHFTAQTGNIKEAQVIASLYGFTEIEAKLQTIEETFRRN